MRVASLFSGAGGLDLGLIQAGHKVVWANDIFADAVETYRLNVGSHISNKDIHLVKSSEIPDVDLVVGGFPCQGFSVANWGRNDADRRNFLYQEMVRVVRDKQPKFFIGENVKGLVSFAKGKALASILEDFSDCGYEVRWAVLNAADYGVPQKRQRVILFGVRKDVKFDGVFPPKKTHSNPKLNDAARNKWVSVGQALKGVPEPTGRHSLKNHTASKYKLRFNNYIGHRVVDPDEPSPTITARGDEKGGVVVIHHPSNKRRMTARELAIIQTFPKKFEFFGCQTSAYRQIANAVPPRLGYVLGMMLKK
jgi:DNA (cytosine-5)-methyltransferase 1